MRSTRCLWMLVFIMLPSCSRQESPDVSSKEFHARVVAFCGDCHAYPKPETFPKSYWPKEVKSGFGFYTDSGRTDLDIPPFDSVVEYYVRSAPEKLTFPPESETPHKQPLQFKLGIIPISDEYEFPFVSFVRWVPENDTEKGHLLFCDMNNGRIERVTFEQKQPRSQTLMRAHNPAHIEEVDLDGDGHLDLIIADLGSLNPKDHTYGRVLWARWNQEKADYTIEVLQKYLGRVADVQPIDFDQDGDLDLIVAEFGWRKSGKLFLLEHVVSEDGKRTFRRKLLEYRHGTSHVNVADINGDRRSDFVALTSQEYEVIEAFISMEDGSFHKELVFEAKNPAFGSSGIELVDLDDDGDLDVLYTNGDTLDSHIAQPFHGVRWLENQGKFPFRHHLITALPGAYRAIAGDLDGDGDLDVVASAVFEKFHKKTGTLIWMEQKEKGKFIPHTLSSEMIGRNITLDLGDFDRDGDIDIVVGHGLHDPRPLSERSPWLTVWWNEGANNDNRPQ